MILSLGLLVAFTGLQNLFQCNLGGTVLYYACFVARALEFSISSFMQTKDFAAVLFGSRLILASIYALFLLVHWSFVVFNMR